MQVYSPKTTDVEVPLALTPSEIKTLLEAMGELPYTVTGERKITDKLRSALKASA